MRSKYEGDFETKLDQKLVDKFIKDNGFVEKQRIEFPNMPYQKAPGKAWVSYSHPKLTKNIGSEHFTVELIYYWCESFIRNPHEIAFGFRSKKNPKIYHFSNLFRKKLEGSSTDHKVGDLHNHFSELFEQLPEAVELMNVMTSIKPSKDEVGELIIEGVRQRLIRPHVTQITVDKLIKNSITVKGLDKDTFKGNMFDLDIAITEKVLYSKTRDINYKLKDSNDTCTVGGEISIFLKHYPVVQSIATIFENIAIKKMD